MKLGILCLIEEANNSPKARPLVGFTKDDSILRKYEEAIFDLERKIADPRGPEHNRLKAKITQKKKVLDNLKRGVDAMSCLPTLMEKVFCTEKSEHWKPMLIRDENPSEDVLFNFLVHCKVGSSEKMGEGSWTASDFLKWAKEKRIPLILFPNGFVLNLANLIWLPNNRKGGGNKDPRDRPPTLLLHWCVGNILKERRDYFAGRKATAADFSNPDALRKLNEQLPAGITGEEINTTWRSIRNILAKLVKHEFRVPTENPYSIAFPKEPPIPRRKVTGTPARRPRSRGKGST